MAAPDTTTWTVLSLLAPICWNKMWDDLGLLATLCWTEIWDSLACQSVANQSQIHITQSGNLKSGNVYIHLLPITVKEDHIVICHFCNAFGGCWTGRSEPTNIFNCETWGHWLIIRQRQHGFWCCVWPVFMWLPHFLFTVYLLYKYNQCPSDAAILHVNPQIIVI